jgi:chemotaxis protein histidine kinase CheA
MKLRRLHEIRHAMIRLMTRSQKPHGVVYFALTALALIPMSAIAIRNGVPLVEWSMVATFILAAAWPIARRMHWIDSKEMHEASLLRSHLAAAADASLRGETLLAANGQRLQEVAEQIRIAALNIRLHAVTPSDETCSLSAVAEDLETLAQRAEWAGQAAIRSSQLAENQDSMSDEATYNLSRLTEELHKITAALDRDLKRTPALFATGE